MDATPPNIRRMPTRVSSACRRCRRNKSRCDPFRPCSLCTRANVSCEASGLDQLTRNRTGSLSQRRRPDLQKQTRSQGGSEHDFNSPGLLLEQPPFPPERNLLEGAEEERFPKTGSEAEAGAAATVGRGSSFAPMDYDGSESAMSIARKIYRLDSRGIDDHPTSAIPDGGSGARTLQRRAGDRRVPISVVLGSSRFPEHQLVLSLVEDYFQTVHWFSLVVYEPKFRQSLTGLEDGCAYPTDAPFLALLAIVLSMAAWYRSQRSKQEEAQTWRLWSDDLLRVVEARMIQVMDQRSIAAVQTCILMGSHYVYHGRPNLSFALLGATIKISYTLGLHRESARGTPGDVEERRRVWWTIYTWDRFASISYGRPLSINDEDYKVGFPTDFTESPYFTRQSMELGLSGISYSPYQTELSRLYRITSPALMSIFNPPATRPAHLPFEAQYANVVSDVTRKLMAWRRQLPQHLSLDLDRDYDPRPREVGREAHTLQSLSLQLTFDNLLIVLHRPFLSRQVEHLSMMMPAATAAAAATITQSSPPASAQTHMTHTPPTVSHDSASPGCEKNASSEYWWSAAVRTARVTEMPQLAQLATDSHLVVFLAMNMFHAAIVLIAVALADPLSDAAQGVKRTIARVFRLQELLGQRSALSKQSSMVLKNLISLLLLRERESMLGSVMVSPPLPPPLSASLTGDSALSATDKSSMSRQGWMSPSMAERLNESLASVQRIFPTFQDEQRQQETVPLPLAQQEMCQVPFGKTDSHHGTPQAMGSQEQVVDYGGNSLFWLWDSNWNGPVP